MSPEVKALFDGLRADLTAATIALKNQTEEVTKQRQAAARAEATSRLATLGSTTDLRFGKESLDAFTTAYSSAKVAATSNNVELATFAAEQIACLDKIVAGKSAEVPGGEKNPAPNAADGTLAKADFDNCATDSAAETRVAAAIDEYIEKNKLTGSDAYNKAFHALARQAGVKLGGAIAGFNGGDVDDE
jgi:hypothetical protein